MISAINALRNEDIVFNDYITIHVPSLDEIIKIGKETYFSAIMKFCSTSSDYKVRLDDMGIDYSQIEEYEFFLMNHSNFTEEEKRALSLVFGNFDITEYDAYTREEFKDVILTNGENIFDKATYFQLVKFLRDVHSLERHVDKPGNEHARKYIIDKERRQIKNRRRIKKPEDTSFMNYIIALVNTPEFPYNYESVWTINIFQFYRSLKQIQKLKNYNFTMTGAYSGMVNTKELDLKSIHWLNNKQ